MLNPLFNYTLSAYDEKHVELVRNWINGTTVQLLTFATVDNCAFQVTPDIDPPRIAITRSDKKRKATVSFTSSFNFTQTNPQTDSPALVGIDPAGLILPLNRSRSPETTTILDAVHTKARSVVEQLAFLSYRSESLAGGWRFLTCKLRCGYLMPDGRFWTRHTPYPASHAVHSVASSDRSHSRRCD